MTDLTPCIDTWWSTLTDFTLLLEELPDDAWGTPTDLPGWDVRAIAAHTAHLEHLLAGGAHDNVDIGEVEHAIGFMGAFTEQGVVGRKDRDHDALINEIRESATTTHTAILANGAPDPTAPATEPFGSIGWTNRTLWRNRPLDLWMHEQDVRRAVGRPGNLDAVGARHTVDYLSEAMGLVLAKRVGAPAGTTLRLEVGGHAPRAWTVNEAGRGEELSEVPEETSVRLSFDLESFIILAGGRRGRDDVRVTVSGDHELGEQVLAHMTVTP